MEMVSTNITSKIVGDYQGTNRFGESGSAFTEESRTASVSMVPRSVPASRTVAPIRVSPSALRTVPETVRCCATAAVDSSSPSKHKSLYMDLDFV